MCCCNCPRFYKARVILLAIFSLVEAVLGIFRAFFFVAPIVTTKEPFNFHSTFNFTEHINIVFVLDFTSSFIPIFMGLFTILFLIAMQCFCCLSCIYSICRTGSSSNRRSYRRSIGVPKAFYRFISLDCNCPCYRARPKLRFCVRFLFLSLFLALRGTAIYFYFLASETDRRAQLNYYSCLISLAFSVCAFVLDFYRYTVWRCYTPHLDGRCHCRSQKHKRYLPYHMAGETRREYILGDRSCKVNLCRNRHLNHVAVFHNRDHIPQSRWLEADNNNGKKVYIGFHITKAEHAVSIAHTEFRNSREGMLGKGTYFARSIAGAILKANTAPGACLIAEIRMGKVFTFEKDTAYGTGKGSRCDRTLRQFVQKAEWWNDYDTCYMYHPEESKDEFCIKDPKKQIIKWIVIVYKDQDTKVEQYGLDTEFDSTKCHCI